MRVIVTLTLTSSSGSIVVVLRVGTPTRERKSDSIHSHAVIGTCHTCSSVIIIHSTPMLLACMYTTRESGMAVVMPQHHSIIQHDSDLVSLKHFARGVPGENDFLARLRGRDIGMGSSEGCHPVTPCTSHARNTKAQVSRINHTTALYPD